MKWPKGAQVYDFGLGLRFIANDRGQLTPVTDIVNVEHELLSQAAVARTAVAKLQTRNDAAPVAEDGIIADPKGEYAFVTVARVGILVAGALGIATLGIWRRERIRRPRDGVVQ
jgi:hypothetical protein